MNTSTLVRLCLRLSFLSVVGLWVLSGRANAGEAYALPATHRTDVLLDTDWRFIREDVTNAETAGFDDSTWSTITLPHTWNNLDGQDGGTNFYRGPGWYRLHFTPGAEYKGREFFLEIRIDALLEHVEFVAAAMGRAAVSQHGEGLRRRLPGGLRRQPADQPLRLVEGAGVGPPIGHREAIVQQHNLVGFDLPEQPAPLILQQRLPLFSFLLPRAPQPIEIALALVVPLLIGWVFSLVANGLIRLLVTPENRR